MKQTTESFLLSLKNKHEHETAYLFGSGPSIHLFEPQEDGVYIGMNQIYRHPLIKSNLTYLFTEGFPNDVETLSDNIIIFWNETMMTINKPNTYPFNFELLKIINFNPPYNETSSMAFITFLFALWCGFSKIYIVGCDCANTQRFYDTFDKGNYESLCLGWNELKVYHKEKYPDVEVVVLNPVNLTF